MRPPLTLRQLASRMTGMRLGMVGLATAAFVGWHIYAFDYLMEIVRGPQPVTLTQLAASTPVDHSQWFTVTGEVRPRQLLKTTTTRRRGGTSVTNHFVLIKNQAVVVETSSDMLPPTFLAWASTFDEDGSYYQRARRQLDSWAGAGPKVPLSPILLKTSSSVDFTQWSQGVISAALAVGLLVALVHALRRVLDYTRIAPLAALRKSVRASEGVPALVAEIDQQLAVREPTAHRRGLILLPGWLLNVSQNSFTAFSAHDVVWAAPYTVKKKLYGVITTSKSEQVLVVTRTGQSLSFTIDAANSHDLLVALYRWAPWAVIGNDEAMEARFGKMNKGLFTKFKSRKAPPRSALVAMVDERREKFFAEMAAHIKAKQAEDAATATPQPPARV